MLFFNLEGRRLGDWKVLRLVPRQADLWRCECLHCKDEATLTTVELRQRDVPQCSCQVLTLESLRTRNREIRQQRYQKVVQVFERRAARVGVHRTLPQVVLQSVPASHSLVSPLTLAPKANPPFASLSTVTEKVEPVLTLAEYRLWKRLRQGCTNPKSSLWYRFGAKGRTMCPEWVQSFESFFAAIGPRPTPRHQCKLIDSQGHYEPGNVAWKERLIADGLSADDLLALNLDGKEIVHSLKAWAEIVDLHEGTLRARLYRYKMPLLEALTRPLQTDSRKVGRPNPGDQFGTLTVMSDDPRDRKKMRCQCRCGRKSSIRIDSLRKKGHKAKKAFGASGCNSCSGKRYFQKVRQALQAQEDFSMQRFGVLRVIESAVGRARNANDPHWRCRCLCNRTIVAPLEGLLDGTIRDCGCVSGLPVNVIGATATYRLFHEATTEYAAWAQAKMKVSKAAKTDTPIPFWEQWYDFSVFLQDMGLKSCSRDFLRRLDVASGFTPGNCCWEPKENRFKLHNGGTNHYRLTVVIDGEEVSHTIREWSTETGLGVGTIRNRLTEGWTPEKAVLTPSRRQNVPKFECVDRRGLTRMLTICDWEKEYRLRPQTLSRQIEQGVSLLEAIRRSYRYPLNG